MQTESEIRRSNTEYLGDGAYVEFSGYSLVLYTSDGMNRQNEVHLEHRELTRLFEFAKQKGFINGPG